MVLILADSVVGSQWLIGQKGIDMANMNDRPDTEKKCPALGRALLFTLNASVGVTQLRCPALLSLAARRQAVIQRNSDHQTDQP